jgi:hypothetical protein
MTSGLHLMKPGVCFVWHVIRGMSAVNNASLTSWHRKVFNFEYSIIYSHGWLIGP